MRWMIPLLLCALAPSLSLASVDTDGDGLTDDWERGLGRYQVIQGGFTWEQAKADAEARGGKLATVTSDGEWAAITTHAGPLANTATLWLGGWRPAGAAGGVAQSWQWVSGEKWNYTRWWFAGEPNSPNHQTADCYVVVNWPSQEPKGSWNDTDAVLGNTFGYLLEFGYPTDPNKADTDGDGFSDNIESDLGSDPNDRTTLPAEAAITLAASTGAMEVVQGAYNWSQANEDAVRRGGRLAALPTGNLYDRVIGAIRQAFSGGLWLGLTDLEQEGVWRWLDGTQLSYSRWASSEPNNAGNEDYAQIIDGRTTMNDLRGSEPLAYILERIDQLLLCLPMTPNGEPWSVDYSVSRDGITAAKARSTDGQASYREYTVTGPSVVDFWWKVSSEQGFDFFSYSLNGVQQEAISGEVDWTYRTLTLPDGTHTIRWAYAKDGSGAVGQDAGWLDDFAVYPAVATLRVRDGETVLDGEATVDFGSADVDSVGFTKTLTLSNDGFIPLEAELSLPDNSPFTFVGGTATFSLFLGRGQSTEVDVFLSTASAGNKSAELTITTADSTVAPPSITLTGYVRGPEISLAQGATLLTSGHTFDMGVAPRTVEFTIRNNGSVGDLVISAISASGNFQITQQPATAVAVGGSTTFRVLALDSQRGLQQGTISIASNDEATPLFTVSIVAKAFFGLGATTPNESVATGGSLAGGWDFSQTALPDGSTGSALKTGATQDNGQSYLEAGFSSRGLLSWNWKVSAQEGFDWLICEVNGNEVAGISTKSAAWQSQVVEIAAGASVRWSYRKDGSASIGEDAGHLADVTFHALDSNPSGYANWQYSTTYSDPLRRMSKSGMKAMFAWLGDFDPSHGPDADHHVPFLADGRLKLRFPISKSADGSQNIRFSSDLRNWTRRGMGQRIVNEDGRRFVVEATSPPNATKGFFKVSGGGDIAGIMVTVRGGTLGNQSVGDFRIGRTEVTSEEWQEVREWALANGYTDLVQGSLNIGPWPVNNVSLEQAAKWCNARSEKEGLAPVYKVGGSVYRVGQMQANPITMVDSAANGYRLPTEAEWEWAARGGLLSQGFTYSGSNILGDVAWYRANAAGPNAVATKLPNELGIYDMSGNVWEWCWGANAPARGGSWFDNDGSVTLITYMSESFGNSWFGFRVARNAD